MLNKTIKDKAPERKLRGLFFCKTDGDGVKQRVWYRTDKKDV